MKKILYIYLSLSLFILSGCSGFLDEIPERDLVVNNAFLLPKQFSSPVNALYQNIRVLYNSTDNYPDWIFHGIGADSWVVGGDGPGYANKPFNDWDKVDAYNGLVSRFYNRNYRQIAQCNTLLKQLENPEIKWNEESSEKEYIQAQVLFFRAYAYRLLGHAFGGVPIITEPTSKPKFDFERATRKEVYEQAIKDAEAARNGMPNKADKPGKLVKAAVDHLLSELYIALADNGGDNPQGLYQKSVEASTRVIDGTDGDYHLMKERFGAQKDEPGKDAYWDLFRMHNHNRQDGNMESLWVIQFERNADGSYPNGGVPIYGRPLFEHSFWPDNYKWEAKKFGYTENYFSEYGGGEGQVTPSNYLKYTIWKTAKKGNLSDERNAEYNIQRTFYAPYHEKNGILDKTDMTPFPSVDIKLSQKNGGGTISTGPITPGQPLNHTWISNTEIDTIRCFYPKIWKFGSFPKEHINREPDRGFVPDIYVFRLAGTLLLRAEAYVNLNQKDKAAADINTVRNRVHAPLVTSDEVDIDYILDERARELMGEELRSLTLMRLNKFVEYTKKYGYENSAKTITDKNNLYPIPQSVIEANKEKVIKQNPGW